MTELIDGSGGVIKKTMRVINNDEKRNILAVIVPALLVAGTANAAEIYNKDGNKVDLYGKAVGLHYFSKGNGENSYGGNGDMTYARLWF